MNITTKKGNHGLTLGNHAVDGVEEEVEFVQPVPKPAMQKDREDHWPTDSLIAAFWWADTTDKELESTMEYDEIYKRGIFIPVLVNNKRIEAGDKLMRLEKRTLWNL